MPWFQSIDALVSILAVPVLFWLWRLQATRRGESGELTKIGIGAWIAAASHLILVAAIVSANGRTHPSNLADTLRRGNGRGFPLLLAHITGAGSRAAPARVNATMMGIAFLSLFLANNIIGWIGGFYQRMGPAPFWLLHAAIACTGGLLVLLFGRRLRRALDTTPRSRCAHPR